MKISKQEVFKLRQLSGCGVLDCKKALSQAKGNFDQALKILKKQGESIAQKKQARQTSQGLVESYVHSDGKLGVLIELACETDFVARTELFRTLAHDLAMQAAAMNPKDTKELLSQEFIKDPQLLVKEYLNQVVSKLGENIQIKRFARFTLGE